MTSRSLVMVSVVAGVLAGMALATWRREANRRAGQVRSQRDALQVWEDEGGAVPRAGHNVREVNPPPEEFPAVPSPS